MRTCLGLLATFTLAASLVHCSSASSDSGAPTGAETAPDSSTTEAPLPDAGDSDAGTTARDPVVTALTPDQATDPVYVGVLPSGHLLVTEGQAKRVLELDGTGKVVWVNATDFTGFEWPRSVAVDDTGRAFVSGYKEIHTFANGSSGARQTYVPAGPGNQTYDWIAYGGTPKRLWALTGPNPTSPKMQFVRFDAATPTAGGTPTVVAEVTRFSVQSFTVDDQNNVYAVDSNECRIRKVTPAAVVSVVAGKPAGEHGVCAFGFDLKAGDAIPPDSAGNLVLPQAVAIGWDPTGKKLVLSGAGMLMDMTEQPNGKALGRVLLRFADGVGNEHFASNAEAIFVIDRTAKAIKKVVF